MKKIFFVVIILFNINIANSTIIEVGDIEPCQGNCPTEWVGPFVLLFYYSDLCPYLIEYYYRDCYPGQEQIQIVAIYKLGMDIVPTPNCNPSFSDLKKAAYVHLWLTDPMGFGDDLIECAVEEHPCNEFITSNNNSHDLRLPSGLFDPNIFNGIIHTVLVDYSIIFPDIDYWKGCTGDICCRQYYVKTRVSGEIVAIEFVEQEIIQPECSYPLRCEPGCGSLRFNWYAPGYGGYMSIEEVVDLFISKIFPNPNEGIFNFEYISEKNGYFDLIIANLNGEIVFKHTFEKYFPIFKISIDIKNLQTSEYYYSVIMDGKINSLGRFKIIK